MANSGSFNTGAYEVRYLRFEWSLADQSIQNNQSVINYSLKGAGSNGGYWYYVQNVTLIINGQTVYRLPKSTQIKLKTGTVLASGQFTIPHNEDGTKTFTASCTAGIFEHDPNVSGSGSWSLPQIQRGALVQSLTLAARAETTLTYNWQTDKECSAVYYNLYTNGGEFIRTSSSIGSGTSGGFVIDNLTPATFYKIQLKCVCNDITTYSKTLDERTYNYPYASSLPDFVIGDKVEIGIANPLGHTVTVEMIAANNVVGSIQTSGTSVKGFDGASAQSVLYAAIPSSLRDSYIIRVTYGTHDPIYTQGGYFSVNEETNAPAVIGSYADVNSTSSAITGDDQDIVQNFSSVRYTAALTAKNGASISSVKVTVNGHTYNLTVSGSSATGGNAAITSGSNVTAEFEVTDSRGLKGYDSVEVTVLAWNTPSGILTIARQDNFYTATNVKCDANVSSIGSNAPTITYAATKEGDSSPSVTGTLTDNVTSVVNLDNDYAWDITVTVTDSFGGSTSYTAHISRGMPIIYFDRIKSSVGVNCFPSGSKTFEVGGDVIINGKKLKFESNGTVTWEAV